MLNRANRNVSEYVTDSDTWWEVVMYVLVPSRSCKGLVIRYLGVLWFLSQLILFRAKIFFRFSSGLGKLVTEIFAAWAGIFYFQNNDNKKIRPSLQISNDWSLILPGSEVWVIPTHSATPLCQIPSTSEAIFWQKGYWIDMFCVSSQTLPLSLCRNEIDLAIIPEWKYFMHQCFKLTKTKIQYN